MNARKTKKLHGILHELNTKAVQDSHLRLLGRVPAESEKG